MTYYDAYVARADDPAYTREDGDWNGNSPDAISPVFSDRECHNRICGLVYNGKVPGKQTDWGCWVAIVNGARVLDVFKNAHEPEMVEFLQSLKDDESYAVVALET